MNKRIVLIIGAGATVSNVTSRPLLRQPPLDKGFFSVARKTDRDDVESISSYFISLYGRDIFEPNIDSLESVMATLYTDIFDPSIGTSALKEFRKLVRLFNRRLAITTNSIRATQRLYLHRIISHFLNDGVTPQNIAIITFNQDLQIEKVLNKLQQTPRYRRFGRIFNFPFCYSIPIDRRYISAPERSTGLFETGSLDESGIKVLKLHGSLNWYSTHRSIDVSPQAMFSPHRKIRMTLRQNIDPEMRLTGERRVLQTLPVIVPPVTLKSSVMHDSIRNLWSESEMELMKSDEIIIFGYSCPVMDFEASNLIQRSLIGWGTSEKYSGDKKISIIDPNPNTIARYVELVKPKHLSYYHLAKYFLQNL